MCIFNSQMDCVFNSGEGSGSCYGHEPLGEGKLIPKVPIDVRKDTMSGISGAVSSLFIPCMHMNMAFFFDGASKLLASIGQNVGSNVNITLNAPHFVDTAKAMTDKPVKLKLEVGDKTADHIRSLIQETAKGLENLPTEVTLSGKIDEGTRNVLKEIVENFGKQVQKGLEKLPKEFKVTGSIDEDTRNFFKEIVEGFGKQVEKIITFSTHIGKDLKAIAQNIFVHLNALLSVLVPAVVSLSALHKEQMWAQFILLTAAFGGARYLLVRNGYI